MLLTSDYFYMWHDYHTLLLAASCVPGFESINATCEPCIHGYYKSVHGVESCTVCPGGNLTLHTGSTDVDDCIYGQSTTLYIITFCIHVFIHSFICKYSHIEYSNLNLVFFCQVNIFDIQILQSKFLISPMLIYTEALCPISLPPVIFCYKMLPCQRIVQLARITT